MSFADESDVLISGSFIVDERSSTNSLPLAMPPSSSLEKSKIDMGSLFGVVDIALSPNWIRCFFADLVNGTDKAFLLKIVVSR